MMKNYQLPRSTKGDPGPTFLDVFCLFYALLDLLLILHCRLASKGFVQAAAKVRKTQWVLATKIE